MTQPAFDLQSHDVATEPLPVAAISYLLDAPRGMLLVRIEGEQSIGELIMTMRYFDTMPGLPAHLAMLVDASNATNRPSVDGLKTLLHLLAALPRLGAATIAVVLPAHVTGLMEWPASVRADLARLRFETFRTREGAQAWLNDPRPFPSHGWSHVPMTAAVRATLLGWRLD